MEAVKAICPAQTLQPQQVQSHLSSAKLAIMTSGLGNIYEASSMREEGDLAAPRQRQPGTAGDSPETAWDGRLCDRLGRYLYRGSSDPDYFLPSGASDEADSRLHEAACPRTPSKARFINLLCDHYERAQKGLPPALAKLADTFETDGAKQAAESIIEHLKKTMISQGPFILKLQFLLAFQ